MKFCTKCGAKIEEGKRFCSKCGKAVPGQSSSAQTVHTEIRAQSQAVENDTPMQKTQINILKASIKLTKTQKLITLVTGIVLALTIISYNVGATLTSRDKVVVKFNQALASKNSSQVAKYIVSSDIKQKIDAKDLDGLFNYIDNNPSYRNEIIKSIEKQSLNMELYSKSKGSTKDVLVDNTYDLFTLKKQGKTWLFYNRYVFELKPVYISVRTNYKDTQIFLGDNLVCTADKQEYEKEIGPYIPGLYKIKAILKGTYVDLEKSLDVDLVSVEGSSNENQKIKVAELYLDVYQVSVDSDYQDAKLFANGKDTGLLVKDAKEFGPVSKDGSVRLYAQKDFPWGVTKSEEVKVNGDSSIYLKLTGVNVKNTLMDAVIIYNKSVYEAFKLRDASKLVNVSENKKKRDTESIQNLISNRTLFIGSIIKTTFDLDSIYVYQKDNKYYAEIIDEESLNSATYSEGSTIPQTYIYNYVWKYTLIYDETSKKWLLDNAEEQSFFNPINKKEFSTITASSDVGQSEYIFSFSDIRIISDAEIRNLDPSLLAYARNEIFARHGYVFNKPEFKNYFGSKSWYRPNPSFKGVTEDFNSIERENIKIIQQFE